jgi:hypothetical protein
MADELNDELIDPIVVDGLERGHDYHSEATVLAGNLVLPLVQEIKPQAHAKLKPKGGYLSQHAEEYRLEGVVSYKSAYTQVAGNKETKDGRGWNTLTTSVIEGLNVLDVLTADRVVAQVSTEHPRKGYVPSINFLGTRYENLQIAGKPVTVHLNLNLLGPKPEDDGPYSKDSKFLSHVSDQHQCLSGCKDRPDDLLERYTKLPTTNGGQEWLECSLVEKIDEGDYPGHSCGHIITVPNFGKIYLATLRLEQSDFDAQTGVPKCTLFKLNMIELVLGCAIGGTAQITSTITNGHTKP